MRILAFCGVVFLCSISFAESLPKANVCYDTGRNIALGARIAISPDGKYFVVEGEDKSSKIFFRDGRPPLELSPTPSGEDIHYESHWERGKLVSTVYKKNIPQSRTLMDVESGKKTKLNDNEITVMTATGAQMKVTYDGDASLPDSMKNVHIQQLTSGEPALHLNLKKIPRCMTTDADIKSGFFALDDTGHVLRMNGTVKGSGVQQIIGKQEISKFQACKIDAVNEQVVTMTSEGDVYATHFSGKPRLLGKTKDKVDGGASYFPSSVNVSAGVVVIQDADGKTRSHNLATGKSFVLGNSTVLQSMALDTKGNIFLIDEKSSLFQYNAKNGELIKKFPAHKSEAARTTCNPILISGAKYPDIQGIVTSSDVSGRVRGTYNDLTSGKSEVISLSPECPRANAITQDGKLVVENTYYQNKSHETVREIEFTCFDPNSVQISESCVNCEINGTLPSPLGDRSAEWIKEFVAKEICKIDFDEKKWDTIAPVPHIPVKLSANEASALLMRFQKPGGLNLKRDLPILRGILASKLAEEKLTLSQNALQSVLAKSPATYNMLLSEFPNLKKMAPRSPLVDECRSPKEQKVVTSAAEKMLAESWPSTYKQRDAEGRETESYPPMKFSDWMHLAPLTSALSRLPKEKILDYKDFIAETIQATAANSADTRNFFSQRVYKFANNASSVFFGEEPKLLTDLSIKRTAGGFTPVMIASHKMDGEARGASDFGFYYKEAPEVKISRKRTTKEGEVAFDQSFSWNVSGRTYKGTIKAITTEDSRIEKIDYGKSLDYEKMWKDKQLVGLFIVGGNLSSERQDAGLEFISYFNERGFTLNSAPVDNVKKFIRTLMTQETGHLDYFADQSHAGGSEKNVVALAESYRMLKANKVNPNGTSETFYFLYPATQGYGSTYISHNEFADWLKEREKTNNSPLAHISISCNSKEKEIYTLESANTPLLIPFATNKSTPTFANHPENPVFRIIDGIRQRQSYQELGKSTAPFMVSGQDSFKNDLMERVMMPTRYEIHAYDDGGKELHLDAINLN